MVYKFFFVAVMVIFCSKDSNNSMPQSIKNKVISVNFAENKSIDLVQEKYNLISKNNINIPSFEVFEMAFSGYQKFEKIDLIKNNYLTIIDFSKSSKEKRMWIIDVENNSVVEHDLVSHGMYSGGEFATSFSNKVDSFKSSLGFYLTGEMYIGKHGLSMKLDGLQKGLNDKARERAVVVHAADYVSKSFINIHGKLGRSQGCPALSPKTNKRVINLIKNKSLLFIYHPSLQKSFKNGLIS